MKDGLYTEENQLMIAEVQAMLFKKCAEMNISFEKTLGILAFFYARGIAVVAGILYRQGVVTDDFINRHIPDAHDKLKGVLMELINDEIKEK